jgi:hypothetical protein
MVYACVKAGKQVAWIVRPTGTGPCTFVGAGGKAGFQNAFELGEFLRCFCFCFCFSLYLLFYKQLCKRLRLSMKEYLLILTLHSQPRHVHQKLFSPPTLLHGAGGIGYCIVRAPADRWS